jgi:hypothetical protein
MRSEFPRLLENVNIFLGERGVRMFGVVLVNQLRQAQGAGHAGGPSANDDDIGFHCRAFNTLKRLTKNDH